MFDLSACANDDVRSCAISGLGEGVVPPQVIEHIMTLRLCCIGFVILCLFLHWICDFYFYILDRCCLYQFWVAFRAVQFLS